MFKQPHDEPWLRLLAASVFFVGCILGFLGLRFLLRTHAIRPYWHNLLLRIPTIGRIVLDLNMSRFNRTLGILMKSGLPIVEALRITQETTVNRVYRDLITRAADEVERGVPLSEAMMPITEASRVKR